MMSSSSAMYLLALVATVMPSLGQELLWDHQEAAEDQQADSLALLQLRAVLVDHGRGSEVNVLAVDDTAGDTAKSNSSVVAAAAAAANSTDEVVERPAHHKDEAQTPELFWSWASVAYRVRNFKIEPSFWPALTRSFCIVGVAELFDKTWFVALICAVSFGIKNAFFGSFAALLLHTLIAAALGLGISQFLSISVLHFITAAVFAVFAGLFSWEWHVADPEDDALQSRKEEAQEDLGETPGGSKGKKHSGFLNLLMWQCFTSVFIAEWGDRTQIAMIALHSSLPVLPVCIGSALAFFVLTLSAVLVAALLEGRNLSERTVCGVSAVSFLVFSLLAVKDGMDARLAEMPA